MSRRGAEAEQRHDEGPQTSRRQIRRRVCHRVTHVNIQIDTQYTRRLSHILARVFEHTDVSVLKLPVCVTSSQVCCTAVSLHSALHFTRFWFPAGISHCHCDRCITNFHITTVMLCCPSYITSHYILGMYTLGHLITKIVHEKYCWSEEIRLCYLNDRPFAVNWNSHNTTFIRAQLPKIVPMSICFQITHNFENMFENIRLLHSGNYKHTYCPISKTKKHIFQAHWFQNFENVCQKKMSHSRHTTCIYETKQLTSRFPSLIYHYVQV